MSISAFDYDNTHKITKIELTPVFIPFQDNVRQLLQEGEGGIGMALNVDQHWVGGDFIICRLFADSGHIGSSEAFMWLPETGTTPAMIIDVIQHGLSHYVLNRNPGEIDTIYRQMNNNVAKNEVAKGLIDSACYELAARIQGIPVHRLLSDEFISRIPLAHVLPLTNIERILEIADSFYAQGVRTFRCKLGNNIEDDVKIIKAMRDKYGNEIRLRVDYNQAYSAINAVKAIRAIQPFSIDYVEQPVSATDFPAMAYVQQRVSVPVMAHGGCFGLQDIVTLGEMGAINIIGINGERPGGITNAMKAIEYATQKGFGVAFHNQPTGIGSAMILHLVATNHTAIKHPTELQGHLMLEHDLLQTPINYKNGYAHLPYGTGWGVTLDTDSLKYYATRKSVVIE